MQQQAKIFLADERGVTNSEWFRSYNTFNFGNYTNEHKVPVQNLYVCNDDTLAGEKSITLAVDELTTIIILPIAGAIEYKDSTGVTILINSGQLYSIILAKGNSYSITNPYSNQLVNFLQLWYKATDNNNVGLINFNIDAFKNTLVTTTLTSPAFFIGKFDGRKEIIFDTTATVFAFIVQGAFEVEGILLHARDGLALWHYSAIEVEALSNDAIIILLKI
jgi:redox-sensitive bicupin YhaK (pirin superfamily)